MEKEISAPQVEASGRVLVVDDDPGVCEMVRQALESHGYSVDVAAGSGEAMRRILSGHYSAAVLDYLMPGGDGIFLYQHIATVNPELARHVLVITGAELDPRLAHFLRSVGNRFLRKPFSIEDLLQGVRSAALPPPSLRR